MYLQAELPKEQLSLVLRHELNHIYLRHGYFSGLRGACLLLHWWNPILWLAFRYMGRDMELACDQRTLDQLEPEQRKEYARPWWSWGRGGAWEAPLCFGECDGALRVRAAVAWRPDPCAPPHRAVLCRPGVPPLCGGAGRAGGSDRD